MQRVANGERQSCWRMMRLLHRRHGLQLKALMRASEQETTGYTSQLRHLVWTAQVSLGQGAYKGRTDFSSSRARGRCRYHNSSR